MNLNPLRWFSPAPEPEAQPQDMAGEYTLQDDAVLQAVFNVAATTASGIRVTQETALASTAVLACLIVRSETFGTLPAKVYRDDGGSLTGVPTHWAHALFATACNPLLTPNQLWRWKQLREDISGNAHVRVERGPAGRGKYFWPLTGPKPRLFVDPAGVVAYEYQGDEFTKPNVYPADDIMHFKGPFLRSPYEAASLIDMASEAIGITIGSEQFFGRLLGNGSHFPAYFERDDAMKQEDLKALGDQLKGGIFTAGKMPVFDRGLKFKQNAMSLKDAELTEQQRLMLQKVCSIFRVPLAMVQDLTHGTYTNSEQQDLWLAKHTMTPICVSTEATIRQRLFPSEPALRVKFNLDGLMRGDYKTRTDGDATLVNAGIIRRNEARGHYDLNPIPGLDAPLVQLGMGTVDEDGTIHQAAASESSPAAVATALAPILRDAVSCIRRRDEADRAKGKDRSETEAFAAAKLAPVVEAFAAAGEVFDAHAFIEASLAREPLSTLSDEGGAQ